MQCGSQQLAQSIMLPGKQPVLRLENRETLDAPRADGRDVERPLGGREGVVRGQGQRLEQEGLNSVGEVSQV